MRLIRTQQINNNKNNKNKKEIKKRQQSMWFKKKKGDAEAALEAPAEGQSDDPNALPEVPVAAPQQAQQPSGAGDVVIGRMSADLEKLKAQFSTFYELQKASNERFGNINEQLGGIRSQMMEREKDGQKLVAS